MHIEHPAHGLLDDLLGLGGCEGEGGLKPKLAVYLVQDKEGGDLLDALICNNKANQILVKLVQLILDALLNRRPVKSPLRKTR